MKRLVDAAWAVAVVLVVFMTGVHAVDRFTGNGTAITFYAPDIDMTCVAGKDEGQKYMYCLPGDHSEGQGGAQ